MRYWSGSEIAMAFIAIVLGGIGLYAFVMGIVTCEFGC